MKIWRFERKDVRFACKKTQENKHDFYFDSFEVFLEFQFHFAWYSNIFRDFSNFSILITLFRNPDSYGSKPVVKLPSSTMNFEFASFWPVFFMWISLNKCEFFAWNVRWMAMWCAAYNIFAQRMNPSMAMNLRRITYASPIHFVFDQFLLNVTVAIMDQLAFAFLTGYKQ